MKKLIYTIVVVFISCQVKAQQDIHLSQFFNAPVTYNPATAGVIDGDFRIFANYRNQWSSIMSSPYKTTAFSVDAPMLGEKPSNGSFFGLGLNVFSDTAGESMYKSNSYNVSVNYCLEIGTQKFLSFGVKGGYLQRNIDYSSLFWKNQFVVDNFIASRPTGETALVDQVSAIDLGAGIFYYNRINRDLRIFGGVASEHLNSPNVSLISGTEKYLRKYVGHFGAEISKKNTNLSYMPNAVVMIQDANRYIDVGMDLKYLLKGGSKVTGYYKEVSASGGLYYRVGDAAYVNARVKYDEFAFGVSYDLNISPLSQAVGGTGAFEFMLTYEPAFTERAKMNRLFR